MNNETPKLPLRLETIGRYATKDKAFAMRRREPGPHQVAETTVVINGNRFLCWTVIMDLKKSKGK